MSHISVVLFTDNAVHPVPVRPNETSESICLQLCQQLNIKPVSTLLFALRRRYTKSDHYVPGNRVPPIDGLYEFRLRYQVADPTTLKVLDKRAYDYFYYQVKADLEAARIPGLEYPAHKDEVSGFCVTNMYIDMREQNRTVDQMMAKCVRYLPAKLVKKHSMFLRLRIEKQLKDLRHTSYDPYYAKAAILNGIQKLAPNYLVERCSATTKFPPEDDMPEGGECPVELVFAPFDPQRPGLSVFYAFKNRWRTLAAIHELYAVVIKDNAVLFEIRGQFEGFEVEIKSPEARDSFVSAICGYYRLMVKWTVNLCADFASPQLERLLRLKCHGPIGGPCAYSKLQLHQNTPGSCILRQCETTHDTYYLDIISKGTPVTFRLTCEYNNMWHLHGQDGTVQSFGDLVELVNSIRTGAKQNLRLGPSENDKTPNLLLCLPPNQVTVKKTLDKNMESEMRKEATRILHPNKDFRKYENTAKLTDDGIIMEMRADWMLPRDKKLEVTLKVLQKSSHQTDFMHLASRWSALVSPELIKMYGFTLLEPQMYVIESIKMGPLDEFLRARTNETVELVCLLDAAYTLARALHYLQENQIVHCRIRCAKLQVVEFTAPRHLMVRLGDPGFGTTFQQSDLPWIPHDYDSRGDRQQWDYMDEIWSYTTTLWEIFMRGHKPTVQEYLKWKRCLPMPKECPLTIYMMMLMGWNPNPELRFTPQMMFSPLIKAREEARSEHNYTRIATDGTPADQRPNTHINGDHSSNPKTGRTTDSQISIDGSIHSDITDCTNLSDGPVSESSTTSGYSVHWNGSLANSTSHIPDPSDISSATTATTTLQSPSTTTTSNRSSAITSLVGTTLRPMMQSGRIADAAPPRFARQPEQFAEEAIELENGKRLVRRSMIGRGEYGVVFRGYLEDMDDSVPAVPVAIKIFTDNEATFSDFYREVDIMRKLDHRNIVKIITILNEKPVSIVMELVEYSSFLGYLSHHTTLKTQKLLGFAQDIASGMQYLGQQKIVHRDLAARNVLVDASECVKISDFGLAQMTDKNGYYTMQNRRSIPIKWYAPETLITEGAKYSHQSDVWSFGVTLFEMFSRGKQPDLVPGVTLGLEQLRQRLEMGERLARPPLCPLSVYDNLMMECWMIVPKQRPNFGRILQILEQLVSEIGEDA